MGRIFREFAGRVRRCHFDKREKGSFCLQERSVHDVTTVVPFGEVVGEDAGVSKCD